LRHVSPIKYHVHKEGHFSATAGGTFQRSAVNAKPVETGWALYGKGMVFQSVLTDFLYQSMVYES
jgi:hypothetical protein